MINGHNKLDEGRLCSSLGCHIHVTKVTRKKKQSYFFFLSNLFIFTILIIFLLTGKQNNSIDILYKLKTFYKLHY